MHQRKYFTLNFFINEIFSVKKFPNYGMLHVALYNVNNTFHLISLNFLISYSCNWHYNYPFLLSGWHLLIDTFNYLQLISTTQIKHHSSHACTIMLIQVVIRQLHHVYICILIFLLTIGVVAWKSMYNGLSLLCDCSIRII